jgi:hypothetical protein
LLRKTADALPKNGPREDDDDDEDRPLSRPNGSNTTLEDDEDRPL